jgi:outer membrane receptor protein involved in Fe transport
LSELGDPQDSFNWNTSLQHGRFTFGYQMRYISKMVTTVYEDFFEYSPGCSVSGACPPNNADAADITWYPSTFYHDVRLGIDVTPRFNFYVGVDNLTNKKPPYGLTGIGAGSAIFDNRGRFYYSGLVAKF